MKKLLIVLTVLLLLATSAVAGYVILDPAGAGYMIGLLKEPVRPAPTQVVAKDTLPPATEATTPKPNTDSAAPAAKQETAKAEPPRRPPTRAEIEKRGETDQADVNFARKGRFVGAVDALPPGAVPSPAELYPMSITKRTYPDANTMSVEIAVKNSSGTHWKTGYVYFKSPGYRQGQQFEVADWQIDEIVGFDYVFPRSEVRERMAELRVLSVSGDARRSALAEQVSQSRLQGLERAMLTRPATETTSRTRRAGEKLEAPGLLGLFGQSQQAFTGVQVSLVAPRSAVDQPVRVAIDPTNMLERQFVLDIRGTNEERQTVAQLVEKFHQAGLSVEDSVAAIADELNSKPYREAARTTVPELLTTLRTNLNSFNTLGVELATSVQRSKDSEVRKAESVLTNHSKSIRAQIEQLEKTIKLVDPQFQVQ